MAAALWNLGLYVLGLYEGLDSLSACTHGLGVVGLHLLQTLLDVLLDKARELRVHLLKRFVSFCSGCLDAIWCHF